MVIVTVEYLLNKASVAEIAEHLTHCDADFVSLLSARVEIKDYAKKIASKAVRFEAWSNEILVGLVAAYCNDMEKQIAYISSVSVLQEWAGKGVASKLINQCIKHAKGAGMHQINLEVANGNVRAINLYKKNGFSVNHVKAPFIGMNHNLKRW